ncbi:MAG: xanthine dehydrogenase [Gemmatimonadetes bacterium]|nr:xanthine dehydrogenase [Gemmatimonadota bacterium]
MKDVFEEALRLMAAGEPAALSTIVSSKGSLPMSKKAKMLVQQDGTIVGTVGGGCLEGDVWSEARDVMEKGRSSLQTFILTEEHAGADGLNCGGNVEVFTEPVVSGSSEEIFREIAAVRADLGSAVLATLVSADLEGDRAQKLLVREDGTSIGSLGEDALDEVVQSEVREMETVPEDLLKVIDVDEPGEKPARIFLESICPEPTLYLFGGGHVSFAIARIAATVGFRIVVVDDRPMFANKDRFPMADETLVLDMETAFEHLPIDDLAYVCAVTRGHQFDKPVVEQAIKTDAAYIGMLGSRRKVALMWKEFEDSGVSRARLEEIHAPIGLDIGSDNPEEIAVSVVGELIRVRRSGGKPAHQVASMFAAT